MAQHNIKPILVTAAGGRVGGVSTFVVEMLRKEVYISLLSSFLFFSFLLFFPSFFSLLFLLFLLFLAFSCFFLLFLFRFLNSKIIKKIAFVIRLHHLTTKCLPSGFFKIFIYSILLFTIIYLFISVPSGVSCTSSSKEG
jgi:hypothetical protein